MEKGGELCYFRGILGLNLLNLTYDSFVYLQKLIALLYQNRVQNNKNSETCFIRHFAGRLYQGNSHNISFSTCQISPFSYTQEESFRGSFHLHRYLAKVRSFLFLRSPVGSSYPFFFFSESVFFYQYNPVPVALSLDLCTFLNRQLNLDS